MSNVVMLKPLAPQEINEEIEARFTVHRYWENQNLSDDVAGRITAMISKGDLGASAELMDRFPSLKVITVYGVGFDKIDLAHAAARGIQITTTPNVLTDAVADLAIGLMFAASRRIAQGDRFVRRGDWGNVAFPLGWSLRGEKVGILGYGRIGRRIGELARALGMTVLYTDLAPVAGEEAGYRETPDALAKDARVLIIAAAGGAGTNGLVNRAVLSALGPDGLLVNVARGSIVNESDLVVALENGELGAAALDVFADEPNVPEALKGRDNVVLTPHVASGTIDARLAMGRLVIENLAAHFASEPLVTPLAIPGPK